MPILDLESCSVVGPEDPIPSEVHAVEELCRWLALVSGRTPPTKTQRVGSGIALVPDVSMGPEAFRIETEEAFAVISGGRPRGVLYGAYEFLDRFLGIRWLSPDEALVPEGRTQVSVPDTGLALSPILSYREPYYTEAFDGDWAARNRMNSNAARLTEIHGGRIRYVGFVHTFNRLIPPEEYFASHPEYFSEIEGSRIAERTQLCLTNPDVVRIAANGAMSWLEENPDASIISVSQNDWHNPCQCADCSKIDEEEGSHSGSLLSFVNQVAEIIEGRFPHVWVDTLAYQYTRKAPKTMKPRRNVIVRLCSIECCFSHPLATCPENVSFKKDTEEWAKVAHSLYVWDYVTNFAHYIMPFPNLRVLQPNIQFFVRNNVKGIFEEGNYSQGGGGEFAHLRSYLLARLLWQPDCDIDAAKDEFMRGFYGDAATSIGSYIDALHDRVERDDIHVRIYHKPDQFLDPRFVEDSLSLFDEAEDRITDAKFGRRVRLARLPLVYSKIALMDEDAPDRRILLKDFIDECKSLGITNISEGKTLDVYEQETFP